MKKIPHLRNVKLINAQTYNDGIDGSLFISEHKKHIPFPVKRVYWISRLSNKNAMRGMHAHRRCRQVLFCLRGSFEMEVYDGKKRTQFKMSRPGEGLYMGPLVWHAMKSFSRNTLLLVLASELYQEKDYIRDFREFRKLTKK